MKRIIALILLASLMLTFSGCGMIKSDKTMPENTQTAEPVPPEKAVTGDLEDELENPGLETEEKGTSIPDSIGEKAEPVYNTPENVFFNDSNNAIDVNAVSIKPRYVYWDNGSLVAECFVINGFSHNVYNIDVKALSFSNDAGLIASAGFGTLNGATIAPNSYLVWTFSFAPDTVAANNALLSHLICNSSIDTRS